MGSSRFRIERTFVAVYYDYSSTHSLHWGFYITIIIWKTQRRLCVLNCNYNTLLSRLLYAESGTHNPRHRLSEWLHIPLINLWYVLNYWFKNIFSIYRKFIIFFRTKQAECDQKLMSLRDDMAADLYDLEEEYYSSINK